MARAVRLFAVFALLGAALAALPTVTSQHVALAADVLVSGDCDWDDLNDTISGAASGDTILFDCDASPVTIGFPTTGQITINKTITIDGGGDITLDGNNHTRHFAITNDGDLTLENITLENGYAENGRGGAIRNAGGAVTVTNATFSGNSADISGGAIYNFVGTLTVTNSTLSGNTAGLDGGAILSDGTAVTITNSTLIGNSAATSGGAIDNSSGTLTVTNSTLTGNAASSNGGAILNDDTLTVTSSTIAGNSAAGRAGAIFSNITTTITASILVDNDDNCFGFFTSGGYNLIDDASCNFTSTGDIQNGDANLGPLADNGGPTPTMLPTAPSDAIDAIPTVDCPTSEDQRGVIRPQPQGNDCDIGAVEVDFTAIVLDDANGLCTEAALDSALSELDTYDGGGSITFDCPAGTIIDFTAPNTGKQIDTTIAIDSINEIIFDGGDQNRHFAVSGSGDLALENVTLENGHAGAGAGSNGGSIQNVGTVTLTNSTFSENSAAALGGAIHNDDGTLTVINTTFSSNTVPWYGGAIYNIGGSSTLTIRNSTFANNSAVHDGGAIQKLDGTLNVTNSTFTGNTADEGGAIYNYDGTLTVTSSTLAGNSATGNSGAILNSFGAATATASILVDNGVNCGGNPDNNTGSGGYNLTDDTSCNFTEAGDIQNGDANLDELADNGGPTQTMLPLSPSNAIDAISADFCGDELPGTDQRGFDRPQFDGCDIGAVEVQITDFPEQSLCANRYNADLRMPRTPTCASTEFVIELPDADGVDLCVNRYNGDVRYSRTGTCASTETAIQVLGIGDQPVCVNRYNGDIRVPRVKGQCASTETARMI